MAQKKTTEDTIDIKSHALVPKHKKLDEKEIETILNKYNILKKQLPRILKNDPAIKDLDVKLGDVIRIERLSPTSGTVYFYRVVSNA